MNVKLTIGERLKDLRKERKLTQQEVADATGVSHSAIGKYELDTATDISPFNLVKLAEFFGVSMDYIMGMTEQRTRPESPIEDLHISDSMIEALKGRKFNNRLLSEMVTHEGFLRFMLDAEVYVDQIAAMNVANLNEVLEYARNKVIEKYDVDEDVYMRTLDLGQVEESRFVREALHNDLDIILDAIREAHKDDITSGNPAEAAAAMDAQLDAAYNGVDDMRPASWEQMAALFCEQTGVPFQKLSDKQVKSLIEILKKSDLLQNMISQRGKK